RACLGESTRLRVEKHVRLVSSVSLSRHLSNVTTWRSSTLRGVSNARLRSGPPHVSVGSGERTPLGDYPDQQSFRVIRK
ncbi:unnamed protein product, partial [Ectocarpus fasciculatus]